MPKLNAKELLLDYHGLRESVSNLSSKEKKLLEVIKCNPGLTDNDLAIKSGLTFKESKDSVFSLARKSLVHIVNEDMIYPMY